MSNIVTSDEAVSEVLDGLGQRLASRIRRERQLRGWSVSDLAASSGVSRAMISKVERAEASPTAALLGRLSGAFGLTVSTLLARAEVHGGPGAVLAVADQTLWTDPATGYVRRSLTPSGSDPELVLIDLPPGATVPYTPSSYAFLRGQCVWVQIGQLTIREGTVDTVVGAGDVYTFDLSATQHCAFRNPSDKAAVRYLVALSRR